MPRASRVGAGRVPAIEVRRKATSAGKPRSTTMGNIASGRAMRDPTRWSVRVICANHQGLSRFSSATAALYSTKVLGHVSTAARSAVSASALFPFTTCHWPR